jgi:hypothetical protein
MQLAALMVSFGSIAPAAVANLGSRTVLSGEQKQWHKLSLTFEGPTAGEADTMNPFRNYRLDVTFTHVESGRSLVVPGYFAADGNAHETGARAGTKWRANFAPDAVGTWKYRASFQSGSDVALSAAIPTGKGVSFHGEAGSFDVEATDKTGPDFRGKGRLQEVGQHYLQHLGTKEYFVKAGAGSPENFLAYVDFDNTTAGRQPLHHYTAHVSHYRTGDPTWKGGKGKAIIGALNYLAGKKMNSLYFLTMNVGGDGDDVFPWVTKTTRDRYDVSKLAQWEIVFEHMTKLGIHLHMMTQEQENDQLLDGGALGVQRKLYYRELVARFGHHLGVTWNLGEETTNTAAQRDAFADHFNALDPYFHLIAVHTFPGDRDEVYTPMLAHPVISGASLQLQSPSIVHAETLKWVQKSAAAGQKWVVAVDELGAASVGVVPDSIDPNHPEIVHRVLWGSLMAGGAGVEWYFGYNYAHHDLTCEDWTTRDKMWTLTHHAAQFVRDYLPLPMVANRNDLTSSSVDYCFGKPGVAYAIYLPAGATTGITLPAGEAYTVHWFNPRTGGAVLTGSVSKVAGGATVGVGRPPSETSLDWVALLCRTMVSDDDPVPPLPQPMSVTRLTLVSAASQTDLRVLSSGSVIDLAKDGTSLNVRADVRVVPYSEIKGGGSVGVPLEVTFTVLAGVTEPVPSQLAITRFVLVDASAQRDLRELTEGSVIDLSQDGTALNIRAEVGGTAGSVWFAWNSAGVRTENTAVYAFAQDDANVYRKWTPPVGTHSLKAVPYSHSNRGGTVGLSKVITLKVVN